MCCHQRDGSPEWSGGCYTALSLYQWVFIAWSTWMCCNCAAITIDSIAPEFLKGLWFSRSWVDCQPRTLCRQARVSRSSPSQLQQIIHIKITHNPKGRMGIAHHADNKFVTNLRTYSVWVCSYNYSMTVWTMRNNDDTSWYSDCCLMKDIRRSKWCSSTYMHRFAFLWQYRSTGYSSLAWLLLHWLHWLNIHNRCPFNESRSIFLIYLIGLSVWW